MRGKNAQIDVRGPTTLDDGGLARAAAIEGMGLSYLHEHDVLGDIAEGRLIRVLKDWTPPFPGLCIYYPGRRNPSAGLKAFVALAREMAGRAPTSATG